MMRKGERHLNYSVLEEGMEYESDLWIHEQDGEAAQGVLNNCFSMAHKIGTSIEMTR